MRSDPSYRSCEDFVAGHFFELSPSEVVEVFRRFVESDTEFLPLVLLWRVKRILPHLTGTELMRLVEAAVRLPYREHDSKSEDIFTMVIPFLIPRLPSLALWELNTVAWAYGRVRVRHLPLFQGISEAILLALQREGTVMRSEGAVLKFFTACGQLHMRLVREMDRLLTLLMGPLQRSQSFTATSFFAQFCTKMDFENHPFFLAALDKLTDFPSLAEHCPVLSIQQVAFGQILMPLTFRPHIHSQLKDRLLASLLEHLAVTFPLERPLTHTELEEKKPPADRLSPHLLRQLQTVEMAVRLERPFVMAKLSQSARQYLLMIQQSAVEKLELTRVSSKQHYQVELALKDLELPYAMEVLHTPYEIDVVLRGKLGYKMIEVDGPLHFVNDTHAYHIKTQLKHRLLAKLGWQVYHIAWDDWPDRTHNRQEALRRLLFGSSPPPAELSYYTPLFVDLREAELPA
ncbi:unnamed protein product [Vitrella brassicaformis CCMP3155]|uniref:RAP domain-containing protein n=1 Tax=Vitrella brassicaformis (strain CCMP3155) TaxID=1169540 RepID=A0A0G4EFH4_VITBC|nr:unnamed protein product [Vitrella brassicaformis CCMP3155]|eukprot:CEL94482.1 unnamed protein product [Vitrella brassicaformis CCMP3155]